MSSTFSGKLIADDLWDYIKKEYGENTKELTRYYDNERPHAIITARTFDNYHIHIEVNVRKEETEGGNE